MRAPEVDPVQSLRMGPYAMLGILALALSLAGVMGGHHLLGAAFGTGEPDEALALPIAGTPQCPGTLRGADACDLEGHATPPTEDADGCDGVHEDKVGGR